LTFDIRAQFRQLDNRMSEGCPACASADFTPHSDHGRRLFARAVGVQAQLYSCAGCGHKAFQPELDISLLAEIYADPYFRSDDEEANYRLQYGSQRPPYIDFALRIQALTREWGLPGNARIHEFGCGAGVTVKHLRDMGFEATGSDWSPAAVAFAHEMGNTHIFREDMNVRDAFSGERLDMVLNLHAIEHVPRPIETLQGFAEIMDEGTVLFLNTNQGDSITNRRFGMMFDTWYYFPQHLHYFSPRSFEEIARRAGFKILDIRTSPRWFDQIDAALGQPTQDDTHAKRLARVTRDMANQEMEMTLVLGASRFKASSVKTPAPQSPDQTPPADFDSHENYFGAGGPWSPVALRLSDPLEQTPLAYIEQNDQWRSAGAYLGDHWVKHAGGDVVPALRFVAPSAGCWELDAVAALTSLSEPTAKVTFERGRATEISMTVDGLAPQHLIQTMSLQAGEQVVIDVETDQHANEQIVTFMVAARLEPVR